MILALIRLCPHHRPNHNCMLLNLFQPKPSHIKLQNLIYLKPNLLIQRQTFLRSSKPYPHPLSICLSKAIFDERGADATALVIRMYDQDIQD